MTDVTRDTYDTHDTHLSVVDAVSHQDMEEVPLLDVVPLPEHLVVPVGPVHVQVHLPHLLAVRAPSLSAGGGS